MNEKIKFLVVFKTNKQFCYKSTSLSILKQNKSNLYQQMPNISKLTQLQQLQQQMQPTTKQALRTIYKIKRQELIKTKGSELTQQLGDKLKQCIDALQSQKQVKITIVGSYFPDIKREIVPPKIKGYQYAFPYFAKKGKEGITPLMQFKLYQNEPNNLQNTYGIKVPPKQLPTVFPQLVLVPLMCFSPDSKQRIGYGGGYYDRYINFSRSTGRSTIFVGIGDQTLKTQQDFKSKNDEYLDFIITESHIY